MAKLKLFCFPYAGGSAMVYNKWREHLNPDIELVPVELAGRGKRIHEPLYRNEREAIDDVLALIERDLSGLPYALFGHSLGGKIAYQLAQTIRHKELPPPVHVFLSGRGAPHSGRQDEKIYHLMTDDQFKHEVMQLGGTPPEFFQHPELLELFLPILKNDFKIAESPDSTTTVNPLDNSITVIFGEDDDLTAEECDNWRFHTRKTCNVHYFPGGHFFLHQQMAELVKVVNTTLRDVYY